MFSGQVRACLCASKPVDQGLFCVTVAPGQKTETVDASENGDRPCRSPRVEGRSCESVMCRLGVHGKIYTADDLCAVLRQQMHKQRWQGWIRLLGRRQQRPLLLCGRVCAQKEWPRDHLFGPYLHRVLVLSTWCACRGKFVKLPTSRVHDTRRAGALLGNLPPPLQAQLASASCD